MQSLMNRTQHILTSLAALVLLGIFPVSLANAQALSIPVTSADPVDASPYRQSNVNKAWIVGDPAAPEETLIQRLDMGTIVKVLHSGNSWDRVEVIDGGQSAGWVLKQLFDPAMSGLVQQAVEMQKLTTQQSQLSERGAQLALVLDDASGTRVPTPQANAVPVSPADSQLKEKRAAWHRALDRVRDVQGDPARSASAPTAPVAPTTATFTAFIR